MQKNVASQKKIYFAFDATTNLPKTGDAANITPYEQIDYGTVTAITDTSMSEVDSTNAKGYYVCDLTQAETNGNEILFTAKSSTSNIVVIGAPAMVVTVPANSSLQSIDSNGRVDVIKVAGTTQTARDIGASVLLSNGTGTGQLKLASGYVAMTWADIAAPTTTVNFSGTTIKTATDIAALLPAALVGGRMDASVGAIASGVDFTATMKASTIARVTLVDTVTTYTGNTPQTGDTYALANGASGFVALKALLPSALVGGRMDSSMGAIAVGVDFTATMKTSLNNATPVATLSAAYDAAKTAAQAGDAMTLTSAYNYAKGTVAATESYATDGAAATPIQLAYMTWSLLAERSRSGVTLTAGKLDGTAAMTFTLDSATAPSSQTRAT